MTRRRTHLQSDRNRVLNRIRRLLETANFKLGSVVSDISGRTAHLILDEIAHGNCDPKELAQLAKASLKYKKSELAASLHGFYSEHFRWLGRRATCIGTAARRALEVFGVDSDTRTHAGRF